LIEEPGDLRTWGLTAALEVGIKIYEMRITTLAFTLFSAALAAAGPACAAQVVLFTDGRSLEVESVDAQDGSILLALEDGGQIAVPVSRIVNWQELERRPVKQETPVSLVRDRTDAAWRSAAGPYADTIALAATRHRVDPALLTAMARVESNFNPSAISPKGAQGLLQLMPQTADRFGVKDAFDVEQNVEAGARYMSWLLERFEGQTDLALAGYNAGESAVERYDGIPPYSETRRYVTLVMEHKDRFAPTTR